MTTHVGPGPATTLAESTSATLLDLYRRQAEACAARGCALCRASAEVYREALRLAIELEAAPR